MIRPVRIICSSSGSCAAHDCLTESYALWLAIDLMFALTACVLCFVEPVAAASGMPGFPMMS